MKKLLIGKGTFSKAYLTDQGYVELHSVDPVKECMALWGFGDSRLWPQIERIECQGNGWQVFKMPLYDKPKSLKNSLNPDDWEFYKALKAIPRAMNWEKDYELKGKWHRAFDKLRDKWAQHVEALDEALDSIANYGFDICFEISPRNVAVKDGNLILLDCFFLRSKLREVTGR